jgi:hypothetical protein
MPFLAKDMLKLLLNRIARNQRWIRENPICAGDPNNYHAQGARAEIAEDKTMLKRVRLTIIQS